MEASISPDLSTPADAVVPWDICAEWGRPAREGVAWERVTSRGRRGGRQKGCLKSIYHRVEKSTEVRKTVLVEGRSQGGRLQPTVPTEGS